MNEKLQLALRELSVTIRAHQDAWPFLDPVDVTTITDYLLVVDTPVDLSLVDKRARRGSYASLRAMLLDLHLIVDNCRKYNAPETEYVAAANKLEAFFVARAEKLVKDVGEWAMDGLPSR